MNEHFFIYNGFLFRSGRPVIAPDHPSFSYGDGIFETIRMCGGKIVNEALHFERLKRGMDILQLEAAPNYFQSIIENLRILIHKNHQNGDARIRISVSRSSRPFSIKHSGADYLIESEDVDAPSFDKKGIDAVIYTDSQKGMGALSNLKSKNYLLNILAYRHAQVQGSGDSVLLNAQGRVCETAIANIYFVEGGKIFTPALSEGCVAGTVRQWLFSHLPAVSMDIAETQCAVERLLDADEVFISNAIKWVQPVTRIQGRNYGTSISEEIFRYMEKSLL